jgi:hypothetical protein
MGSDTRLRDLYLPAGTTLDLAVAKRTAGEPRRTATIDGLRILLDENRISHDSLTDPDDRTDQALTIRTATLRTATEHRLHQALDRSAVSLQGRDVTWFRFDDATDNTSGGGVDAYVTGGLSCGDNPTGGYGAWDIVVDTDQFPDGWCHRLGAACGLLDPHGDGPAAAVVTFHGWAAPALGEGVNP